MPAIVDQNDDDSSTGVISVVEETARFDKAEVVTGRVHIRTLTEGVEEVIGQNLASEKVEITRVAVDREVAEAPAIRQEGDVTIISVVEEIIIVTKRLVVLSRLREGQDLNEKVEMAALYVRDEEEADFLTQFYGDGTAKRLPLGDGRLLS